MKDDLELWLVRHGETTWNSSGLLAGWSDAPLNTLGEEQARSLKPLLEEHEFSNVWCSDLSRAVRTAELAWGSANVERRIREINFGDLEGEPWTEIDRVHQRALQRFEGFSAPSGETLEGFEARILEFVASLPAGRHLIFTHGGVIRVLTKYVGIDRFLRNGELVVLNWTSKTLISTTDK
jgi:probable phosphoglycerate mutase